MEKHYEYPINLRQDLKTFERSYKMAKIACTTLLMSILLFLISIVIALVGKGGTFFIIFCLSLTVMVAFLMLLASLTNINKSIIPIETVDDLNQIIGFEDGNYIPKYQFIDVDNTTPEKIVVDINYPHKAVEIIENKHLPLRRKSDAIHNAHVDASRIHFKKHTSASLTSYVYARLDIRHAINDKSYEDAYSKRRLANAKKNATIPLEMRDDN